MIYENWLRVRWRLLLHSLFIISGQFGYCEVVPNVRTKVITGYIQNYKVTSIIAYQHPINDYEGNSQSVWEYDQPGMQFFNAHGTNGPPAEAPDVAILNYADILTPENLQTDFDWLYHASGEPFVHHINITPQDFYIGLFEPDGDSYAWIHVHYEGDGAFSQISSAVAYGGETLVVGYSYGDFNRDSVTNGRDFLTWQRDSSLGPLSEWQDNYGNPPYLLSIPEPSTIVMCVVCFISFTSCLLPYAHTR